MLALPRARRGLLGALLVLVATGCDANAHYVCTAEFRTVQVRVVNAVGQPVEGLEPRSVLERDGQPLGTYDPEDPTLGVNGLYPVASDANLNQLGIDGDAVVFTAEGPTLRAEARYILADDGCHITREEGPTEITAVAF